MLMYWLTLFIGLSVCSDVQADASLDKRIEILEKRIKHLKRNITHSSIKTQNAQNIHPSASLFEKDFSRYVPKDKNSHFIWESDDEAHELMLSGFLQFNQDLFTNVQGLLINDGRASQAIINKNTMLRYWFNRASPIFEATIQNAIHLIVVPDFGREQVRLFDGLMDVNYYRMLGIQVGYQRSLVAGIENLHAEEYAFVNYAGFSTALAPNRELGAMIHGSIGPYITSEYSYNSYLGWNDWLAYQFGLFNGAPDGEEPGYNPVGGNSLNYILQPLSLANKSFEARILSNPFIAEKNSWLQYLSIGIGMSTETANNQSYMPDLLSIGQNPIFAYEQAYANGLRTRIHPQLFYHIGRFGIMADWTQTLQHLSNSEFPDTFYYEHPTIEQRNKAGEIQMLFNLTGETFTFTTFKPNQPFHFFDTAALGGWQLALRFSYLHMDPSVFNDYSDEEVGDQILRVYHYVNPKKSIQNAKAFGISLLWYWSENFRIVSEYTQTTFTGGCSSGAYLDPNSPGCLTANDIYIDNITSLVSNRPTEKVFMQRFQIFF